MTGEEGNKGKCLEAGGCRVGMKGQKDKRKRGRFRVKESRNDKSRRKR